YPSKASASGTPDKGFIYNWQEDRWSRFEIALEMLHTALSQSGKTLEQLDPFGTLEQLQFSLDDPFWIGAGRPSLAGFTTAHKIALFNGQYMPFTVDTGEIEPTPGYRAQINGLRSVIEGNATVTVQIGHRGDTADDVTWSPSSSKNAFGYHPTLVNDQYMRVR